jgi:hypothetical protein
MALTATDSHQGDLSQDEYARNSPLNTAIQAQEDDDLNIPVWWDVEVVMNH